MKAVMKEIEKRELIEQQRKIFEAGAQRADKRTGSFSFLTWPFLIAPLIASKEFLAAAFNPAAAEDEDAKAALAGAALQAANDDPPASGPAKTSAEDETANSPAASLEAHASRLDPTALVAEPHEDAPKPSSARSEAVAAARGGGGGGGGRGGGGGDDANSRPRDARASSDDSSDNSLSADSHVGSGQPPSESMLESCDVFGASCSPSIICSAPPVGIVGTLSSDAAGTLAPLTTLSHDVAGAIAPVITLTNDVTAAVPPVLAPVTGTVDTLDPRGGRRAGAGDHADQ